jgi:MHS family proline/betaine transporter-like MFS transporter
LYFVTSLVFLGLVKPLFVLLELHHFGALLLFMALYQTAVSCSMASYFPILSSLFSTATRYTGIAFCYNVVYAFMGSVPFWITWLIEQTSSAVAAVYLLGCALIAALSTLCLLTRGVNR